VQTRVCQICSKRPAKYVCLECGRIICEVCLEPQTWVCSDCYGYLEGESRRFWIFQSPFFRLLLLSFLLIFIGVVFILISVLMGTPVSAGVVVSDTWTNTNNTRSRTIRDFSSCTRCCPNHLKHSHVFLVSKGAKTRP